MPLILVAYYTHKLEATVHLKSTGQVLPFETQWASDAEMDFLLAYLIFDLTPTMLNVAVKLKH